MAAGPSGPNAGLGAPALMIRCDHARHYQLPSTSLVANTSNLLIALFSFFCFWTLSLAKCAVSHHDRCFFLKWRLRSLDESSFDDSHPVEDGILFFD